MNEKNLIASPEQDPSLEENRALWKEIGKDLLRKSSETIDGAAKQVIAVAGILEGLYFHAVAYSDIRGQLNGQQLAIYLAPVLLLLISLASALVVFFPERYKLDLRSPSAAELIYRRVVRSKYWALVIASAFLILGVGALFLAIYDYLAG